MASKREVVRGSDPTSELGAEHAKVKEYKQKLLFIMTHSRKELGYASIKGLTVYRKYNPAVGRPEGEIGAIVESFNLLPMEKLINGNHPLTNRNIENHLLDIEDAYQKVKGAIDNPMLMTILRVDGMLVIVKITDHASILK